MEIRRAIDKDAEEISKLINGVAHRFTLHPEGKGAEEFLKSINTDAIRQYIEAEEFQYFVGVVRGKIAGVIAIRGERHLFHLFVAEPCQGRGLARKLWEHAKKSAIVASNIDHITVNSTVFAIPVYERFGFAKVGEKVETKGIAFVPMAIKLSREVSWQLAVLATDDFAIRSSQ